MIIIIAHADFENSDISADLNINPSVTKSKIAIAFQISESLITAEFIYGKTITSNSKKIKRKAKIAKYFDELLPSKDNFPHRMINDLFSK